MNKSPLMKIAGMSLLLIGVSSIASAAITTPEIDPQRRVPAHWRCCPVPY